MSGRIDASNGLLLIGNGSGGFNAQKPYESGFLVKGDAKGIAALFDANDKEFILATQNKDSLVTQLFNPISTIKTLNPGNARWAEIKLKNGKIIKQEFYYGTSFLSQSSRKLVISDQCEEITFHYANGEIKTKSNF